VKIKLSLKVVVIVSVMIFLVAAASIAYGMGAIGGGNGESTIKITTPSGYYASETNVAPYLFNGVAMPIKSVKVVKKNQESNIISAVLMTSAESNLYKSDTNLFKYKDNDKYKVLKLNLGVNSYEIPTNRLEVDTSKEQDTGKYKVNLSLDNNGYLGYYNLYDAVLEIEFYKSELKNENILADTLKKGTTNNAFIYDVLDGKLVSYSLINDPKKEFNNDFQKIYNFITLTYFSARNENLSQSCFKNEEFLKFAKGLQLNKTDSIYQKSSAIMEYVKKEIKYDFESLSYKPEDREAQTVLNTIKNKKSNCQGIAFVYYALARYNGLECNYVSGVSSLEQGKGHRWNVIHDTETKKKIFIDVTGGYVGYGESSFFKTHMIYNAESKNYEPVNPYEMKNYIPDFLINN
jgi:transglutaminase-like putative cysteine protease